MPTSTKPQARSAEPTTTQAATAEATPAEPTTAEATSPPSPPTPPAPVNQVRLVGRISMISEPAILPSGDTVITLRLVVGREPRPTSPRRPSVDTIDVACWNPEVQTEVTTLGANAYVEVIGALRRRFFRTQHGPASRYEVEAGEVRAAGEPV